MHLPRQVVVMTTIEFPFGCCLAWLATTTTFIEVAFVCCLLWLLFRLQVDTSEVLPDMKYAISRVSDKVSSMALVIDFGWHELFGRAIFPNQGHKNTAKIPSAKQRPTWGPTILYG